MKTKKVKTPPAPKLPRAARVKQLIAMSTMSVVSNQHALKILIDGPLSKLPSVGNNRLVMIPKRGMLNAAQSGSRSQITSAIQSTRAMITKNPAHAEILEGLTKLWENSKPRNFEMFPSSVDERIFVVVLCGDLLARTDTHNVCKATADWLQSIGVFKNDLHVDMLALRAKDYSRGDTGLTRIAVVRANGGIKEIIGELASTMFAVSYQTSSNTSTSTDFNPIPPSFSRGRLF